MDAWVTASGPTWRTTGLGLGAGLAAAVWCSSRRQQRGSVGPDGVAQLQDDGRLQRVQSPLVAIHEMQVAGGALQSSEVDQAEALTEDPSFLQRSSSGATPASPSSPSSPSIDSSPTPVVRSFSMHGLSDAQELAFDQSNPALAAADAQRRLLPKRIILVRHGESEANADHTLLRTKPDNLIELTAKGSSQARAVGRRIKALIGEETVCFVVSPFERTLQTSRNIRLALDDSQIIKTSIGTVTASFPPWLPHPGSCCPLSGCRADPRGWAAQTRASGSRSSATSRATSSAASEPSSSPSAASGTTPVQFCARLPAPLLSSEPDPLWFAGTASQPARAARMCTVESRSGSTARSRSSTPSAGGTRRTLSS